ncbi:beta-galactosidase [Alkalihalobacillus alcalophilus ATCC 27647 = CGMCC 1.3604]|uniref:Beta-galactosidase n=1 Tax=Alkalihalobacillus alcalophilus ATCC 27647 = CGMCC 1.3604 TaxID=1218173 RepID=A0A4S4JVI5_ALKAL|nr:beta-galactosidase [Alkalihalobacillus alcalophilus]THG89148.1 beta-galactosidase [Alkalihalobacillus alcalophilus ATCC 27647 = CGMCC 1.3604]
MISRKLPKVWYGGDYNPEQWDDPAVWEEDIRMFKKAGIDIVTLNVFSWALNQPNEDIYRFTNLDAHINRLYEQGIYTCLATSTAAHPAWMAKKYPDVRRVDFYGRKRTFGGRHNSCPNSPTYREYSEKMADKLGERYKEHPAVLIWHVSNEYGGYCYCENCTNGFQRWLQKKYGSLEKLNQTWNTRFWGHTFYEWDEIVVPNALSEEGEGNVSAFQGISLDYRIFQSESLLECYKLEHNALKKHTPDIPVTTNLMGTYPELDYFKWGKEMDVISWDSYPGIDTPVSLTAMTHDLMRGLKDGQPFMLMEQTPSQQNWQPYNALKRPGVMRLWSYQAMAHGADTIMFFQLRRSIGACEKFHGAVIEHVGHEHTRVFRETADLGKELQQFSDVFIDSRTEAKVAIVYDWENRWAIELSSGPSGSLDYVKEVHKYYAALYELNIPVDIVSTEDDLSKYDLVIAPVLYMVKKDYHQKLESFVEKGGTFITTFFSGIVDEHDLVTLGGYPGKLRKLLGIWVEEIDALDPSHFNQIVMKEKWGRLEGQFDCNLLFDIIHTEGADIIAEYGSEFYQGLPVVTANNYGNGKAIYVGSSGEQAFINGLIENLCQEKEITSLLVTPSGVEVTERSKEGRAVLFVLNHNDIETSFEVKEEFVDLLTGSEISGTVQLREQGVMLLEKINK